MLNCWVTDTKLTPLPSKDSTILAKSARERVRTIDFVDDDGIDLPFADFVHQLLQSRTFHVSAREAAVIVLPGEHKPSLVFLA